MKRCIIIDDDPFMRDLLKDKLEFFKQLEVVGIAKNGNEGLEKISKLNPDLILLDVEMTDMTGFEMLSQLKNINFQTIFVTSYGHYAIKAIRINALDYLLKPVDLHELKNAINRFQKRHISQSESSLKRALININKSSSNQRLFINTQIGELGILINEIVFIQGERNYSKIHLETGKTILVAKTLVTMEERLPKEQFFRCHKSYIVGRIYIEVVGRERIVLTSGRTIVLARRRKEEFIEWWDKTKK